MNTDNLSNEKKGIIMRTKYRRWKLDSLDEAGYFVIFQGFIENNILNKISGNALKLYIYIGMNSNNLEGVMWHSNRRIAEYFNKSERTIRTWMKELEILGLIKRMRLHFDGAMYTYLQPYSARTSQVTNNKIIEGILKIDKNNNLNLYVKNECITINNRGNIYLYDNLTGDWLKGKLGINRTLNDVDDNIEQENDVIYVFKSNEIIPQRIVYLSKENSDHVKVLM